MAHALFTGPIEGVIPVDHPNHPDGLDVTPGLLMFEDEDEVAAVADAIEHAHRERGTLPRSGE